MPDLVRTVRLQLDGCARCLRQLCALVAGSGGEDDTPAPALLQPETQLGLHPAAEPVTSMKRRRSDSKPDSEESLEL